MLNHGHASELRESRLEIVKFQSIWPIIFVWSSQDLKDFEDLIDLRITHEKWSSLNHLRKNAACGPKVYSE